MVDAHNDKGKEKPSAEANLISLLQSKLPQYIVNCFITTGYDTVEVIKDLDDQKLNDMETFINKHFPKNIKYIHPDYDTCMFPPGHRLRIIQVVKEIRSISLTNSRKRTASHVQSSTASKAPKRATKISEDTDNEHTKLTLKECYTKVRNQIVKWQRNEQNKTIQKLTENHDYEIQICEGDPEPSISIMCKKCGKKCALGLKGQSILLSNWKRHVSSCISKKNATHGILKGAQLHNFFKLTPSHSAEDSKSVSNDSQNFQKAPPANEKGADKQTVGHVGNSPVQTTVGDIQPTVENEANTQSLGNAGGAVPDIHVDWSRKSRNTLKLLESGEAPGQTKITDYCKVVDRIDVVIKENYTFIEKSELKFNVEQNNGSNFHSFFRELLSNAEKNCSKLPTQRRHNTLIKQFSTALFVYSGPIAYNFIHKNMPECLPSLRTVQRLVHTTYTYHMEGVFQFKGLEEHLNLYKATKIVSISEDATRLIGRVDYDKETDRLVGFVLPSSDEGIPVSDSFIAVTFDFVKETFMTTEIGKYVLVYMAQPLQENVPAYCLMCTATDNRYNAELITKRWKYIYDECLKRGIQVISYGADGDSKQLRSMKLTTGLSFKKPSANSKPFLKISPSIKIPERWKSWFLLQNPTSIAYVQDTIHLAVKLKARLLKTSIILPFGNFVAGIHHLRIVQQAYGKDQHGLREKDLNPIDRQNFDAVTHITSSSTLKILETIPDARGTQLFLEMIKQVIESYLSKKSTPVQCIRHAWYAVYFCRYWRYWLLNNPNYTLKNNFITSNAYCCIELNAHALIIFLMTLRDSDTKCDNFFPCLLGSQPCEKAFRAMRSMSGMFSTIINFSMLGFLRKLHRMHIQLKLEGEMKQSGIVFPRSNKHSQTDTTMVPDVSNVSNEDILETVKQAKEEAQEAMEKLGMADTFKQNGDWINPCSTEIDEDDDSNEDDSESESEPDVEDMHEKADDNNNNNFLKETLTVEDKTQLCADIDTLKAEGVNIVEKAANQLASELQNICEPHCKVTNTDDRDDKTSDDKDAIAHSKKTHNIFFEIIIKGKPFKIHKVTAVWLLQEGEKVSSDRLFRVRSKQPYNNTSEPHKSLSSSVPNINEVVCVGDFCVFMIDHNLSNPEWKVGKILQFSQYKEKLQGKQQYFSKHVVIKENLHKIGVLCTWYDTKKDNIKKQPEPANVEFIPSCSSTSTNEIHYYHPLSQYICTIPPNCFINGSKPTLFESVLDTNQDFAIANSTKTLVLPNDVIVQINSFISNKSAENSKKPNKPTVQTQLTIRSKKDWIKVGSYTLTTGHKEAIIKGHELDDMHINVAQLMLKQSFPELGGLQNVLLNNKSPLKNAEAGSLQILHVNNNHWAALSYFDNCICYYDSSYSTLSPTTKSVIANLFHSQCNGSKLIIHIKDVAHQSGVVDCGLYAIAYVTAIAYGNDPCALVYCQDMLRSHFIKCLQQKYLIEFPVKQTRRPRAPKQSEILLYCLCKMPDDGEQMVFCEQCDDWYHAKCLGSVGKVPEDLNCKCGTILSITE